MATPLRHITHTHTRCISKCTFEITWKIKRLSVSLVRSLSLFRPVYERTIRYFYRRQSTSVYDYLFKFESKSQTTGKCLVHTWALAFLNFAQKKRIKTSTGELILFGVYFICISFALVRLLANDGLFHHACIHICSVPIIVNHTIEIEIIVIKCILRCLKFVGQKPGNTHGP